MDIQAVRPRAHLRLDDPDRGPIVTVMLVAGGNLVGVDGKGGPRFVAADRLYPITVKRPTRPQPTEPKPTAGHVHVFAITASPDGAQWIHHCNCGEKRSSRRFDLNQGDDRDYQRKVRGAHAHRRPEVG